MYKWNPRKKIFRTFYFSVSESDKIYFICFDPKIIFSPYSRNQICTLVKTHLEEFIVQ